MVDAMPYRPVAFDAGPMPPQNILPLAAEAGEQTP
jgi:hypothetical protein